VELFLVHGSEVVCEDITVFIYVQSSSMMFTTATSGLPWITLESPVSAIVALNASSPSAMVS